LSYPPPPDPTRPLPPEEPASGQPWSAQSGDPLAAQPPQPPATPQFQPGYAPMPTADSQTSAPPDGYPPTSQFPAVQDAYPPPPGSYGTQPPGGYDSSQPSYGTPSQPGYGTPPPAGYGPPQPGYGSEQPGYGPPGYGPPPGYGAPPPRPPKRSNTPLVAVLIAVTLLLCAGGVTSAVLLVNRATDKAKEAIDSLPTAVPTEDVPDLPDDLPTDLPTLPTLPTDLPTGIPNAPGKGAAMKVEYEITGDGPVEIVYMEELGKDPKRVRNASLPWRKKVTLHGAALISVVAVRGSTTEGTISCRATVDGKEVAQKTRTGTFITTSCSKVFF
jgi:Mycobacterium membrane protein